MKDSLKHLTLIFDICSSFLKEKEREKRLEETRTHLSKELISMAPDQSKPGSSGDKPKKSKDEVETEEREKMQCVF